VAVPTVSITTIADARDAYRSPDLRQGLYDAGAVVMADVLVNLHGEEHKRRRRVENRLFRRETFLHYENELFPAAIERTLAPYARRGHAELVHVGHELMLNLAALTAGVDLPEGTEEEWQRLFDYTMSFVEGATLAHSTLDRDERSRAIHDKLVRWDAEFLQPSVARRRALIAQVDAGELDEADLPRDVVTVLLRNYDALGLRPDILAREVAFMLLAAAHTSATAFVRSIDAMLSWIDEHPEDAARVRSDPLFVQRCVHETLRLHPSSPTGVRRALDDVTLKSGVRIAKGDEVVIDLIAVNTDQEVFGPDAPRFNPYRQIPPGMGPFGLSFASGMHVCIGQDLAAGVVPTVEDPTGHLLGLVSVAVRWAFDHGVRRDPTAEPERDTTTKRPYWKSYPVLLEA
jgi:cytochrome P450